MTTSVDTGSRWRHAWLPAAWLFGVLFLTWARTSGGFDPTGHRRGVNWPGDLRARIVLLSVEVLVLYSILRPWSYRRSWARAGSALLLFAAWTVLGGIGTLHGGRIDSFHYLWLVLVTIGLLGSTIASSISALMARRTQPDRQLSKRDE